MGYYVDLAKISLEKFKKRLKTEDLLPSQQILRENIDEKFEVIKLQGLKNMEDLKKALKTKKDVDRFSLETSLPTDFLTVLRREVNSYHPQPRKIKDFPEMSSSTKSNLKKIGVKTTVDLFNEIATKKNREILKEKIESTNEEVLLLAKLTDVSRLRYVNQTFATLLINSEYDSVEKIREAEYQELHNQLMKVNEDKNIYRGRFNLNDSKFLVIEAMNTPLEIEY